MRVSWPKNSVSRDGCSALKLFPRAESSCFQRKVKVRHWQLWWEFGFLRLYSHAAFSLDMRMKWVTTLNGRTSTTSSTGQTQDGKAHGSRRSSIKRCVYMCVFAFAAVPYIGLIFLLSCSKKRTYSFNVSGTTFNLHPKYKLIKPIGTGSYGVVISAQVRVYARAWNSVTCSDAFFSAW